MKQILFPLAIVVLALPAFAELVLREVCHFVQWVCIGESSILDTLTCFKILEKIEAYAI